VKGASYSLTGNFYSRLESLAKDKSYSLMQTRFENGVKLGLAPSSTPLG